MTTENPLAYTETARRSVKEEVSHLESIINHGLCREPNDNDYFVYAKAPSPDEVKRGISTVAYIKKVGPTYFPNAEIAQTLINRYLKSGYSKVVIGKYQGLVVVELHTKLETIGLLDLVTAKLTKALQLNKSNHN